jgi:hypothetical protein
MEDIVVNYFAAFLSLAQVIIHNNFEARRSFFVMSGGINSSIDNKSCLHLLINLLELPLPQILKAQILRTIGSAAVTFEEAYSIWDLLDDSFYLKTNGDDNQDQGLVRRKFWEDYDEVESNSGVFPITVALFDVFRGVFFVFFLYFFFFLMKIFINTELYTQNVVKYLWKKLF